jgi:hypothetical protein
MFELADRHIAAKAQSLRCLIPVMLLMKLGAAAFGGLYLSAISATPLKAVA